MSIWNETEIGDTLGINKQDDQQVQIQINGAVRFSGNIAGNDDQGKYKNKGTVYTPALQCNGCGASQGHNRDYIIGENEIVMKPIEYGIHQVQNPESNENKGYNFFYIQGKIA